MKTLIICLGAFFLTQSCHTKSIRNKSFNAILEHCDELDIIYYSKDTFIYKTIDTSAIALFDELISEENEKLADTCQITGELIYKNKGREIFTAQLSIVNIRDSISCDYVTYFVKSCLHRHRLTYRVGMSIDGIYWRKVDPLGNPSFGLDSTKFRYEEMKNNR